MDDELRLIRAVSRRDRTAWAVMYDRHVSDVFGLVFHLLGGDRAAAEEVTQDVWLLAIEKIEQFNSLRGDFRSWLLGIARHRVFRHYRRSSSEYSFEQADGPSGILSPGELIEELERNDVVRAALLALPDDQRRVLMDKYADGISVAEIAARTGRTLKGVESLLSRARAHFRALLQPYFSTPMGGDRHEPSNARPV